MAIKIIFKEIIKILSILNKSIDRYIDDREISSKIVLKKIKITEFIEKRIHHYMDEYTLIIDLTQDLEVIWKNIKRSRREGIKRAERRGIIVEINTYYEEFIEMFNTFCKFLKLRLYNVSINRFKNSGYLFVAKDKTGEIIAGIWFYTCQKETRLRAGYGASKRYISEKRTITGLANALIIWESIKWAKKRMKIWDFGGYATTGIVNGIDVTSINKWKKSFGGKLAKKVC